MTSRIIWGGHDHCNVPSKPKVRRSLLRGLPPGYDPIVRLQIVRILTFSGGLRALVEGDRITDSWLLHYLGLEAVSQSPQPRAAIQHALEHLLTRLEKKPIQHPKGITLSRNLDELSRALDLSPVERDIVLFVTVTHYSRELARVLQQLRDLRLTAQRPRRSPNSSGNSQTNAARHGSALRVILVSWDHPRPPAPQADLAGWRR